MEVDLNIVRTILRNLAIEVPGNPHVITETFILGPYRHGDVRDKEADQLDLIVHAGWVRPSRDVHMNRESVPATYRPTSAGMLWVRRAWNEKEWDAALSEARRTLEQAATTLMPVRTA